MKNIRLPQRQMDKQESRIMWDFLHEVWYPDYPLKYRGRNFLPRWKSGNLSKYYTEAEELLRVNYKLQSKHKLILNSLIPNWKIDGREEFMNLYKEFKKNHINIGR
jgi:hypothetical protein